MVRSIGSSLPRRPVTHVAVAEPEPNQPQLLIADMENTLQVVQVNPPNSQQEKLLFAEAERSLDLLARRGWS